LVRTVALEEEVIGWIGFVGGLTGGGLIAALKGYSLCFQAADDCLCIALTQTTEISQSLQSSIDDLIDDSRCILAYDESNLTIAQCFDSVGPSSISESRVLVGLTSRRAGSLATHSYHGEAGRHSLPQMLFKWDQGGCTGERYQ